MLKRELKINKKSLLLWTIIILSLFLMAYLIYPSIMSNDNSKMLNEMLKTMPEEVIKMFNMDINGIDTVFGWFKTEGYTLLILITGLYSTILGSNILLKEENDKTIEFLYSKPINRNNILKSKILCGIINIVSMILVVAIFNLFGMILSNNLKLTELILLSILPLFSSLVLFFISLFISTFFTKTKQVLGINIGISFLSYFFLLFSTASDKVNFLKYFSIFTLSDSRYIILNNKLSIYGILISAILISIFTLLTIYNYNKKELV